MSGTFLCYVVLYIMIKSVLKYICLIVIKNLIFNLFIFYFFEIVLPYYLYFYQSTVFKTFECSNENSPNSSCHL